MSTKTIDWSAVAVDQAIEAVEELMRRPKDQTLFHSGEVLAVLDRIDVALRMIPDSRYADLDTMARISADARTKADSQPAVDAVATKGGVLLDLWDGLRAIKAGR